MARAISKRNARVGIRPAPRVSAASPALCCRCECFHLSVRERQADEFYGLLSTYPNLDGISPGLTIADLAARIRVAHRLRTPGAFQAATAIESGATAMITKIPPSLASQSSKTLLVEDLICYLQRRRHPSRQNFR